MKGNKEHRRSSFHRWSGLETDCQKERDKRDKRDKSIFASDDAFGDGTA
jgi:hypothetical protein